MPSFPIPFLPRSLSTAYRPVGTLILSHTSPGSYLIGRLFSFQGAEDHTNPFTVLGQGGAKKEVCFELFLKKSSFQLLSHKKARLWGYSRKNYKVKCIFESLSKAPQSLTATLRGKKRHIISKKAHTLLPRHFDCETASASASFPPLLYSNFFESKAKLKCAKNL